MEKYYKLTIRFTYMPTGDNYHTVEKIGTSSEIEQIKNDAIRALTGCNKKTRFSSNDEVNHVMIPFRILKRSLWEFEVKRYFPTVPN